MSRSGVAAPMSSLPTAGAAAASSALYKPFAAVGLVSLGIGGQAWVRWIISDDFGASPKGDDSITGWRVAALHGMELLIFGVALFVVTRFLVWPLVRRRTLTLDGMIVFGAATMWWMDPMWYNYFNYSVQFNAHLLNFGSWGGFIPGWQSPRPELFPEPVLFIGGFYAGLFLVATLVGCAFLRWLRERRPNITVLGMVGALVAVFTVLDFLLEFVFIRVFQLYTFGGAPREVTLFAGRWYQFPIYNAVGIGIQMALLVGLRYFRDDRGRTLVERGVERVGHPRARTALSLLAVTGAVHLTLFLTYFPIFSFFSMQNDTFPALPSYLRAGICGTGTDYACPSRDHVPIPSRTSLHIAPDDPRLPASVRARQGIATPAP